MSKKSEGDVQDGNTAPVKVLSPAKSVYSEGFSEFQAFLGKDSDEDDAPSSTNPVDKSAEGSEREDREEGGEADLAELKSKKASIEVERTQARLESLRSKLVESRGTSDRAVTSLSQRRITKIKVKIKL